VKEYNKSVSKQDVIEEASLLTQLSHPVFPFIFGVVFDSTCYKLVLEFCGVSEGKKYSLTIYKALHVSNISIGELSWLKILMLCCEGFNYLHTNGIIHNDIKSDNILVIHTNSGAWKPKIIDFNKAASIANCKKRHIPAVEKPRYKALHKHIDPAIYDGTYAPCKESDVYSFGYMSSQIYQVIKSEQMERLATSCMSTYKRPCFNQLQQDIKSVINLK